MIASRRQEGRSASHALRVLIAPRAGTGREQEVLAVHVNRRLLGWGLFLIIVGAIPLLVRGGALDEDVIGKWPSLWPLVLIGWGLGLVLRRTPGELIGSAISVGVLGIMIGGMIATGFRGFPSFGACGAGTAATPFADRSGALSGSGRISVEFNCGSLELKAVDGSDWAVSGSGPDSMGPVVEANAGRVVIKARDEDFRGFVDASSSWTVSVPRAPVVDLGVTLNAGEGSVDMTGANLDALNMTLNAGSLTFDMAGAAALVSVNGTVNAGSATLDLPGSVRDANLTINAGSAKVCLPAGTPLRITWNGTLGSNNFDSLGLNKIDDRHWTTGGLSSSDAHLELDASANAGSFTLELGGSCDA